MKGEYGGARRVPRVLHRHLTDADWVATPDLILSQDRSVWSISINQMPFRAPLICARISGAGPKTNFTLFVTDGLSA